MAAPREASAAADQGPWYRDLTPYHWFVFTVASLAWLFDCLDQQLFILARNKAMESLLPAGMDPKLYGGYATSIFVAGWAMGGLIFGSLGDRYGRAKMLTLTVLQAGKGLRLEILPSCVIRSARANGGPW
jgi:MFS family permease